MLRTLPLVLFALAALARGEPIEVTIPSTADGTPQPAIWFAPPEADGPTPLLVHLHTWSSDYRQSDPRDRYLAGARDRGWAFIHPDFRGPNTRPEAGGSDAARSDILDAVAFARANARIDPDRVYLSGVSGGGHMALIMAAEAPQLWAGVAAAVPPTDLAAWHTFHTRGGTPGRYAQNVAALTGDAPSADRLEALSWADDAQGQTDRAYRARSPLALLHRAGGVPVLIAAGVRDGHEGSVPVDHALRAFDALAFANRRPGLAIGAADIERLTATPSVPGSLAWAGDPLPEHHTRAVLFRRQAGPAEVVLFDGGHQDDHTAALAWLEGKTRDRRALATAPATHRVLILGDSNAANAAGWPVVLGFMRPGWDIVNLGVPGMTVGFDNNGQRRLNTLARLDELVARHRGGRPFSLVLVALGTNDAKAVFDGREDEVVANFTELLARLRGVDGARLGGPRVIALIPPPAWRDADLQPKYAGARGRLAAFAERFAHAADAEGVATIDLHAHFAGRPGSLRDGIHLTPRAHWQVARLIDAAIAAPRAAGSP